MSTECSTCERDVRGGCTCGNPCQAVIGDEFEQVWDTVCGRMDRDKPQIFRGTPWCSEWHRRLVLEQRRVDTAMIAEAPRKHR